MVSSETHVLDDGFGTTCLATKLPVSLDTCIPVSLDTRIPVSLDTCIPVSLETAENASSETAASVLSWQRGYQRGAHVAAAGV